jgi:hypothetical protein
MTSTISTSITKTVTLGSGSYTSPLSITSTGGIDPTTSTGATALLINNPGTVTNSGVITGDAGLNDSGFDNTNPGGAGGTGVVMSTGSFTNNKQITGGKGGEVSNFFSTASTKDGAGGAGLTLSGGSFTNAGTITGGAGGTGNLEGDNGEGGGALGGTGGYGVLISGGTLINTGSIAGGAGGANYGTGGSSSTAAAGAAVSIAAGLFIDSGKVSGSVVFGTGAAILEVEAGASFTTTVSAGANTSAIFELGGSTPFALTGIGTSFTNFTTLAFASGSTGTLSGNSAGLAAGQLIEGFAFGDTIDLTGFAATSESINASGGLVLTNATGSTTLDLAGSIPLSDMKFSADGGTGTNAGTKIVLGTHTLSTTSSAGISLITGGPDLTAFTITSTGKITATRYGVYSALTGATVTNNGIILQTSTGGEGVAFFNGGAVYNNTGASLTGYNGIALGYFSRTQSYITGLAVNAGHITATEDGVFFDHGVFTLTNSGIISGGNDGVDFNVAGGTVVNTGTITAGSTGDAISMEATGNVTNSASGLISGGEYGVLLSRYGSTFLVSNSGIIKGSYTGAYIRYGGTLTNASGGTIAGGKIGVKFARNAGTLQNAGLISGTTIGVQFYNNDTLTNTASGTITGGSGLLAKIDAATIINTGHITATLAGADGVNLTAGGLITNNAGGTISGAIGAALGGAGTIANAGLISGTTTGVQVSSNDTITNAATGTITGASGVLAQTVAATIINTGHITATSADGAQLTAGGLITNNAGATISGAIGASLSGTGTILNAGTISGTTAAVLFTGTGADRLIINAGAVFSGAVQGKSTGSDTLELTSAASIGTITGIGTQYTGFGTLNLDTNADWVFAGANALTGAASIAAGATLTDTGALTSNFAVTNNGLITTDPSSIVFNSAVTGTGTIDIGAGSDVTFNASVSSGQAIFFEDGTGTLTLGAPAGFAATIAQFAAGDEIVLTGFSVSSETYVSGTGLELNGGAVIIHLTEPANTGLLLSTSGSNAALTDIAMIETISTSLSAGVTMNTLPYVNTLIVTGSGVVLPAGGANGTAASGSRQHAGNGSAGATGITGPGTDTLSNAGTISGGGGGNGGAGHYYFAGAGGAGGEGINLSAGGVLTNSNIIAGGAGGAGLYGQDAGGTGGLGGIGVGAASATLNNSGVISGGAGGGAGQVGNITPTAAASGGDAIAGTNITLGNSGTVTGGIGGQGAQGNRQLEVGAGGAGGAGFHSLADGTLSNTGTVTGGAGGAGGGTTMISNGIAGGNGGSGGAGIAALTSGSFSNTSLIAGGAGGVGGLADHQDSGGIGGVGGDGASLSGSGITFTNAGTLDGGAGGAGGGGYYAQGGQGGAGGIGAYIGAAQFSNTGTIIGGTGAAGGLGGNGISKTGHNGAAGTGGAGVFFNGGTLTNAGTIAGGTGNGQGDAVQFGTAAGTLIVENGASFSGNVVAKAGVSDVLELSGTSATALDLNGAGAVFENFSQLSFATGAAWTLKGNNAELAVGQTIAGFGLTDELDITNLSISATSILHANSGGTLAIPDAAASGGTLDLTFTGIGATQPFFLTADGHGGTDIALCYLRGTRILTPSGEKPIETLNIGDEIVTRYGGLQKIKWLGRQSYDPRFIANNPGKHPIRITQGALDGTLPRRDLYISPGHSMLIGGKLILASALLNGITIRQEKTANQIDYFQVELATHDCVMAEGAWSETFADAPGLRGQFHNQAEFWALYPAYQTPDILALCAPRPQAGPDLEAVLLPITERAAATITPGQLEGHIDMYTPTRIAGWARDCDYPELPVRLAFWLEQTEIGTALACDPRGDLTDAGIGNAAFAVTFTAPLSASELTRLTIRHATTGAILPNLLKQAAGDLKLESHLPSLSKLAG